MSSARDRVEWVLGRTALELGHGDGTPRHVEDLGRVAECAEAGHELLEEIEFQLDGHERRAALQLRAELRSLANRARNLWRLCGGRR